MSKSKRGVTSENTAAPPWGAIRAGDVVIAPDMTLWAVHATVHDTATTDVHVCLTRGGVAVWVDRPVTEPITRARRARGATPAQIAAATRILEAAGLL